MSFVPMLELEDAAPAAARTGFHHSGLSGTTVSTHAIMAK